jgi:murein L,D-transpeptidase YafK
MKHRKKILIFTIISLTAVILYFFPVRYAFSGASRIGPKGTRSMESVLKKISPKVTPKLKKMFSKKGVKYPPKKMTFIAIKDTDILEVWVAGKDDKWVFIKKYPVLGASGEAGPKLKQGDEQVPEGIYSVLWLNPNSSYHLSIRIDYPNKFDKEMAKRDKRTRLGGDIFIHGSFVSIGCLAMGDAAIEELFLLVNDVGTRNTQVLIMPYDFRTIDAGQKPKVPKKSPKWVPDLYDKILNESKKYLKTSF